LRARRSKAIDAEMLKFLLKALAQLPDPALRRVMYLGLFGSIAAFALLYTGLWLMLAAIPPDSIPFLTTIKDWLGDWFGSVSGVLFAGGVVLLTFLLFPAVVTIIVGLFLEDVVSAVEARHYPGAGAVRPQSYREILWTTVKFALLVILVNVIALPFYILFLFLPPLNLILFYAVNGYLTGREYFELVGLLRLDPAEAERLRRRHRGRIQIAGMVLVFLMTVPIVNLFAPVVATAFMTHLYHALPDPA
jgi:CysZ protein